MTHKKKRSIIDELFGDFPFDRKESSLGEFSESGYSISVFQTSKGTKVQAKVGKNTDINALRRQLQREYPNAEIEITGGESKPLIRELSTKTFKKETKENQEKTLNSPRIAPQRMITA